MHLGYFPFLISWSWIGLHVFWSRYDKHFAFHVGKQQQKGRNINYCQEVPQCFEIKLRQRSQTSREYSQNCHEKNKASFLSHMRDERKDMTVPEIVRHPAQIVQASRRLAKSHRYTVHMLCPLPYRAVPKQQILMTISVLDEWLPPQADRSRTVKES